MKLFAAYTSVIEALTGIGLLFLPVPLILLLFGSPLTGTNGKIIALIGGVAILSLALLSWFLRDDPSLPKVVKGLLIYNLLLTLMFLYGILSRVLTGPGPWLVISFHFLQTIVNILLLQKKQTYSIN